MKKLILCSALALGMVAPATVADAAKAKKQPNEVEKALKQVYPDAQTQITGQNQVNGVNVFDVAVKSKAGESNAQITEYGAIRRSIEGDIGSVFKSKPEDIEMYRVTNYFVDFQGPKGKNFTGRFDAVGRLLDIQSTDELKRQTGESARGEQVKDEESTKRVNEYVKRELPEAQVEGVYQAPALGQDFMVASLKGGGDVILNKAGQVYSLRQPITKEDFPEPVAKTIQGIFTAPISQLARGEYEYYQFSQQSQQGSPIVVKMRPNGDILDVQNQEAIQSEQAVQAKSKSKSKAAEKKG